MPSAVKSPRGGNGNGATGAAGETSRRMVPRPASTDAYDGDGIRQPPRARRPLTFWKVVLAIIVAIALIRGIMGFTGSNNSSTQVTPSYQVVPCSEHPEAAGC